MRVDWAIPCRYAEVHDNLFTIIGGGIDHMWVLALPSPITVVLAARLIFLPDEATTEQAHKFRVAALAPGGNTLNAVEGELNIGSPTGAQPDENEFQGAHVPIAIQFPAEIEGRYQLEVTVDGASTVSVPLHIVRAPAPEPPATD